MHIVVQRCWVGCLMTRKHGGFLKREVKSGTVASPSHCPAFHSRHRIASHVENGAPRIPMDKYHDPHSNGQLEAIPSHQTWQWHMPLLCLWLSRQTPPFCSGISQRPRLRAPEGTSSGWWLGTCFFPHILRMSSSQLTNILQRGWNHQPVIFRQTHVRWWYIFSMCWCGATPTLGCGWSSQKHPVPIGCGSLPSEWQLHLGRRGRGWPLPTKIMVWQWMKPHIWDHKTEVFSIYICVCIILLYEWWMGLAPLCQALVGKQ